jgi:hypothetical protein
MAYKQNIKSLVESSIGQTIMNADNNVTLFRECREKFINRITPGVIQYSINQLNELLETTDICHVDELVETANGGLTKDYNGRIDANVINEAAVEILGASMRHAMDIFVGIMEANNYTMSEKIVLCETIDYPAVLVTNSTIPLNQDKNNNFFVEDNLPMIYVTTVQTDKTNNQSLFTINK